MGSGAANLDKKQNTTSGTCETVKPWEMVVGAMVRYLKLITTASAKSDYILSTCTLLLNISNLINIFIRDQR